VIGWEMVDSAPNFLGLFSRESNVVSLRPDETLFQKGDTARHMYVVLSGELRIGEGNSIYETLSAGGIVGEMALIDHAPRSATVTASTECTLVQVDEKRFLFLVQQTPMFALNLMRLMSRRLRRMNEIVKG
jgi:CRP/FNR family transcriptional regulator, cyclic AMP receptor protein